MMRMMRMTRIAPRPAREGWWHEPGNGGNGGDFTTEDTENSLEARLFLAFLASWRCKLFSIL